MARLPIVTQRLLIIPIAVGVLGLAAACSSNHAPGPVAPIAPAGVSVAATAPAAGASTANQAPAPLARAQATVLARQGAAAPVAAIDPCVLLTHAEAEAANDTGLAAGARNDRGECEFVDGLTGRMVSVGAQRGPRVRNAFEIVRSSSAEGATPVPGIGDDAYFGINALFALKGDVMLSVQLVGPDVVDGADMHTRLRGLMLQALSRL